MPDNWAPSNPASPDEVAKALLINGPGMNDPIARAYMQRLQGQQGLGIEDMVRGTSAPQAPPMPQPQGPADTGMLSIKPPTQLAGDVVQMPQYPGAEFNRRAGTELLVHKILQMNPGVSTDAVNKAMDGYFGGGAKVLNFPGTEK